MNRISRRLLSLTGAVLACGMLIPSVSAGPIFFAGDYQEGKLVREKDTPKSCYQVRYSTTTTTVSDSVAKTVLQETIISSKDKVNTTCVIPLPVGTLPKGASVGVINSDGKFETLTDAVFLTGKKAQKEYESLAQAIDSVKILSFSGQPMLLVPNYELKLKQEFVVKFDQQVQDHQQMSYLTAPMPSTSWTTGPVDRVSVKATVQSEKPLRAMFSPTHTAEINRDGEHHATVRVKTDEWVGGDDFRLCWVAEEEQLGLRVLSYRGEDDKEDGYFMLVGNPTGTSAAESLEKDVIFVLDTSGSMRGEKIEQAQVAMEYCLDHLNKGDRFNVVTFGTDVQSFQENLVEKSPETMNDAYEFVEGIVASGRTNIDGALKTALKGKGEPGRLRIMIFLTDGTPTVGEIHPEAILKNMEAANQSDTRIFVMGVGHDVNAHLLDKIAEATEGSSEYVTPEEEIDAKVATLYNQLSHPVLNNVTVEFGKLPTHSIFPRKLPALFRGSEIMVFGRYREGGQHTITLSGTLAGKPKKFTCEVDLPKAKSDSEAVAFVGPLWASRKIGYLLQELRLHGDNKELLDEVVRLSKEYGIITEYTSFIANPGINTTATRGGPLGAVSETRRRVMLANQQQAGQWAVNQARNDLQLQRKQVVSNYENAYYDRLGRKVTTRNIYQIQNKTYYQQNGQWVDAKAKGDRKERKVKLYSPEYYELLRTNKDFAKAQQLGWAVSINIGDERIVVEKDGKTQDESLIPQQPQQQLNNLNNGNQFQRRGFNRNQIPQLQLNNKEIQQQFQNLNQLPNAPRGRVIQNLPQQVPQNRPLQPQLENPK